MITQIYKGIHLVQGSNIQDGDLRKYTISTVIGVTRNPVPSIKHQVEREKKSGHSVVYHHFPYKQNISRHFSRTAEIISDTLKKGKNIVVCGENAAFVVIAAYFCIMMKEMTPDNPPSAEFCVTRVMQMINSKAQHNVTLEPELMEQLKMFSAKLFD